MSRTAPRYPVRLLETPSGCSRRPERRHIASEAIFISAEGIFEIQGHSYRIPERFSTREVLSYRSLISPVPDRPRGTTLTAEQRLVTETFLYHRAAACVIPDFGLSAPPSLSRDQLLSIHRWIRRHRPALAGSR